MQPALANATPNQKAKSKGAEIIHEYKYAIKGFAVKVQNDKVLEMIKKNNPSIVLIEPDYEVQTFAPQVLPNGINRVDADLSSIASGYGKNLVDVDIAIIDTGINLSHPDLYVYKQKTF